MSTPQEPTTPAVEGIVRRAASEPNHTVRYFRLRSVSRSMVWSAIIIWSVDIILAVQDTEARGVIALVGVLPFVGTALLLGGIVFGAAASYVYDESAPTLTA